MFDRTGGLLELHEAGAIRLLTGSPTPTERLRILATGQVGIGTATPTSPLHVTGEISARTGHYESRARRWWAAR